MRAGFPVQKINTGTCNFRLPGKPARGRWPRLAELAKEHDASEVIGVVGAEALKLLANGHNARGLRRRAGAADGLIEARGLGGCISGLAVAYEEAGAKIGPGLARSFLRRWEAERSVRGAGRLDALDPVEGNLLPEGDMPELGVDSVGRAGRSPVGELIADAFEDVGGRREGAVGDEGAFEFVARLCGVNHRRWYLDAGGRAAMRKTSRLEA